MSTFRKAIFWLHLVAGIVAGISIGIMCFTGTVLAFEKELIAWSERDARRVEPGPTRLSLEQMQAKLREAQPEARAASIVIQNDPAAAVAFSSGRSGGYYVDPYTGAVKQPQSSAMSTFMHEMTDWHRFLGFHGEVSRPRGKLINGICNIAFCVLAITGLYLWMPRSWSWRAVRPVIWFRQNSTAKARDFNWHNAIGFWSAPVLIVLTLTAIPISFRWGGNLIYTLTGTPAPATGAGGPGGGGGPGGFGQPAVEIPAPPPGAKPMSPDALVAIVQKAAPQWEQITLRVGGAGEGRRGGGGPGSAGGRGAMAAGEGRGGRGEGRGGQGEGRASGEGRGSGAGRSAETRPTEGRGTETRAAGSETRSATAQAVSFTVRESGTWPRTASTTLTLNPYTGEILRRSGYADMNAAQQVRSWTRFLHTGEALGDLGQLIAGLASLGGVVLVYTGFALTWRRFFGKKKDRMAEAAPGPASAVSTPSA